MTGRQFVLGFTFVAVLLVAASCSDDDNPISGTEEHFEAIGMLFESSGIPIVSILRGATTDTFVVPLDALSDHIDASFYDEDENVIDPPTDADKSLSWEFADAGVAEVWQHAGEEGGYEFHLRGLSEGETTVEFFVMHAGHADYRSGEIPLRVEDVSGSHDEPVGLIISDEESGDSLATSFVTTSASSVEGTLSVNAADSTDHMEVEFFDQYGVKFQPAAPPHSLQVISSDTTVVKIIGQDVSEPWAFKLEGVSTGSTTVTINLLHDGSLGKAFKAISVDVN